MRLIRAGRWQLLLGVLLGLALWNPAVPLGREAGDFILLLDDSLSMDRGAGGNSWASVVEAVRGLPSGSRVALVRYAAKPVLEVPMAPVETLFAETEATAPPRHHPLDRAETQLAQALEFGLRLIDPGRPTALVLVTDGRGARESDHAALAQAKAAGVPIYGWAPPRDGGTPAWIVRMGLPTQARIGQQLPLDVVVGGQFDGRVELQVALAGRPASTQTLDLRSGGTSSLRAWLEPAAVGPQLVTVSLRVGELGQTVDARRAVVNVGGQARVLYVSARREASAALTSLRAGGWPVTALRPEQFLQARLADKQVVVLDNVGIGEMPRQAWKELDRAVTRDGRGLIVLGGDRSFGAGAYRHSALERLLPVTAQAGEPLPPAAVLFVVDRSGSMDQGQPGTSRLQLAREAVRETVRMLPSGDQVGLLTFAVEPRLLTPLGQYEDQVHALESGWQGTASGGTRLLPALRDALAELQRVEVSQRLLVLVTDGFIDNENFDDIERQVARAGIDIIALVIGSDADLTTLHRLTDINAGRLLRIDEVAEMPLLMQEQVGKQRNAIALGLTQPREITQLPFGPFTDWPPLDGYAVTKARAEADVYLQSERGDPLLAGWQAGAGRVVTLSGGLDDWAAVWHRWPGWGRFLGGLVEWCNPYAGGNAVQLHSEKGPDGWVFTIDALGEDQEWAGAQLPGLWLADPAGQTQRLTVEPLAPGRFQARASGHQSGRYRATVRLGAATLHEEFFSDAVDELAGPAGAPNWSQWLAQGLVRPLPPTGLRDAMPSGEPQLLGLRPLFLILAALVFLAQLADERGLLLRFGEQLAHTRRLTMPFLSRWLKPPTQRVKRVS